MLIVRQMTPVPALWRGKGASTSTDAFRLPPSAHWHRLQKGIAAEENKESEDESRRTLFYIQLSRTSHGCRGFRSLWRSEWRGLGFIWWCISVCEYFQNQPAAPGGFSDDAVREEPGSEERNIENDSSFFYSKNHFPWPPSLPIMLCQTMSESITGSHHTIPWLSKEEKLFRDKGMGSYRPTV